MKRIYYFLCALALVCTACEEEQYDITSIDKTEVTPYTTTADVKIYVSNQNGASTMATIEETGVFLAIGRTPTTKDKKYSATSLENPDDYFSTTTRSVSFAIEGLSSNTRYQALPFISNRYGMVTGEVVTFTTNGTARVTTKAAAHITEKSAQLNGNITLDGKNVKIEERGFILATNSNPTIQTSGALTYSVAGTTGDYSRTYTGLQAGTRYYFRAFCQADGEILYGEVLNFTTKTSDDATITLSLNNVTGITANSAQVSGSVTIGKDAVGQMTECGFICATDNNPTFNSSWYSRVYYNSSTNSNFSSWSGKKNLSGTFKSLHQATTYHYRMYYKIGTQYYYGSAIKTFTTSGSGGGGSTLGSKVEDFVGTYLCTSYYPELNQSNTDTAWIWTYTSSLDNTEWVAVAGFDGGYKEDVAHGKYNATDKAVKLHSGVYNSGYTFTVEGYGDTLFYSVFYPIYYNSNTDWNTIRDIADGEAWLTFDSSGTLNFGPSDTPDANGHYADGYVFAWFYAENDNYLGPSWIHTQTTFTKISDDVSVPRRKMTPTPWHAPMLLPQKGKAYNHLRRK